MPPARASAWLALGYVLLTVALAYPISIHPAGWVLSRSTDTNLFMWMLAWDTHAFLHHPLTIFDANIFFPLRHTLAFSENMIGGAFFAAPILWVTHNPVLAMNLVALIATPMCAFGAYFLARSVGIGFWGAAIAGLIFGFAPPRFLRLDQLHLACVQWMPFSLAFTHRYFQHGRARDLRWALACFTLQVLTTGHGAAFLTLMLAGLIAYRLVLGEPIDLRKRVRDVGVVGALVVLPALYVLVVYRSVQVEMDLHRTLENWHVSWTSFLASPTHLQQFLIARLLPDARVNETATAYLFPGFLSLALGLVGLSASPTRDVLWRRLALALDLFALAALGLWIYAVWTGTDRLRIGTTVVMTMRQPWRALIVFAVFAALRFALLRRVPFFARLKPSLSMSTLHQIARDDVRLFYGAALLLCIWLSIGPPYGIWQYVYWLPGFNFIRAPTRFTVLGVMALGIVGGLGFERMTARLSTRTRAIAALVLGVLMAAEFAAMPLGIEPQDHDLPAVDRWLDSRPKPFVVAEIPVSESPNITLREWQQSVYMLHSMAHWQKTVHGYSGLVPEVSAELYAQLAKFPDEESVRRLVDTGVTHLVVHVDAYAPADWDALQRRIEQFPQLALEHEAPGGRVYSLAR